MYQYEITYSIRSAGTGTVKEIITAASDYNARNVLKAKFRGCDLVIHNSRRVS